jgi:FtsZ-interacting cell division protein ZipA
MLRVAGVPPLVKQRSARLVMNMVIVIEIVAGIFVLAGAVVFAVRDTRQRRSFSVEQEPAPKDVREVQASGSEHDAEKHDAEKHDAEKHDAEKHDAEKHDAEKHDAEKHDAEKHDAEKRGQSLDPSVGVDA